MNQTYNELQQDFWQQVCPEGALEEAFAHEIVAATWRLRRCLRIEAGLSDPSLSEDEIASRQKAVDRERSQYNRHLSRSTAELRKLQTETAVRQQLISEGLRAGESTGLIDCRLFVQTLRAWTKFWLEAKTSHTDAQIADSSFCKSAGAVTETATKSPVTPALTPRNALCPCNSGVKFKRCCGKNAPPVLCQAA